MPTGLIRRLLSKGHASEGYNRHCPGVYLSVAGHGSIRAIFYECVGRLKIYGDPYRLLGNGVVRGSYINRHD